MKDLLRYWWHWFWPAPPPPREFPASVLLKDASVCEDCGNITAAKNHHCLVCGSTAIWSLPCLLENRFVEKLLRSL